MLFHEKVNSGGHLKWWGGPKSDILSRSHQGTKKINPEDQDFVSLSLSGKSLNRIFLVRPGAVGDVSRPTFSASETILIAAALLNNIRLTNSRCASGARVSAKLSFRIRTQQGAGNRVAPEVPVNLLYLFALLHLTMLCHNGSSL